MTYSYNKKVGKYIITYKKALTKTPCINCVLYIYNVCCKKDLGITSTCYDTDAAAYLGTRTSFLYISNISLIINYKLLL